MTSAPEPPDAAITRGSRSFALASRLFDARTRGLVWALYAWCRYCDDMVDGQADGHGPVATRGHAAALGAIRAATEAAIAGSEDGRPPFDGLARVIRETGLPAQYLRAHLDGFAMDVSGRRYHTFEDTLEYCYHVAGVVGLMMAWLMGVRDADTLQRGCDLGVAFQLTNIARDVKDDAAAGRVYLPADWLQEAGGPAPDPRNPYDARSDAASLMAPEHRDALVTVVRRLLDEADRYYGSADAGVARLPFRCAWAVGTARRVYCAIGHDVRRLGAAGLDDRVTISTSRKLGFLVRALVDAVAARSIGRFAKTPARGDLWTPTAANGSARG